MDGIEKHYFSLNLKGIKDKCCQSALDEANSRISSQRPYLEARAIYQKYFNQFKEQASQAYPTYSNEVEIFVMCNQKNFTQDLFKKIRSILEEKNKS